MRRLGEALGEGQYGRYDEGNDLRDGPDGESRAAVLDIVSRHGDDPERRKPQEGAHLERPFNLQNYAYGPTRVGFGTDVGVSAVCILPGVLVYALAGGSIAVAGENPTATFVLPGAAGVLFVAPSLVPGWLGGRPRDEETKQDTH